MEKWIIRGAFFVVGVFVGVEVCKSVAQSKVQTGADSLLSAIGLGGGKVQGFVDSTLVPGLVN